LGWYKSSSGETADNEREGDDLAEEEEEEENGRMKGTG